MMRCDLCGYTPKNPAEIQIAADGRGICDKCAEIQRNAARAVRDAVAERIREELNGDTV